MLESRLIFDKVSGNSIEQTLRANHNRLLEAAQVGDKPFEKEFYETAVMPHAIDEASNIVVILSNHIGDSVLSVPLITSLVNYITLNSLQDKKMTVISAYRDLFESLRGLCTNLDLLETIEEFDVVNNGVPYCFNLNRKFRDYYPLGLKDEDARNAKKVFFHDCQDWSKEVVPISPRVRRKYDMMPLRIARNMELLFGQKLYQDIYAIKEFIPKDEDFENRKEVLMHAFSLDINRPLIVISPGSTARGKEYPPEHWESLIIEICKKRSDIQVFFIDDPNDEEKKLLYSNVIDRIKRETSYLVQRGSVALTEMNALMHMACVSVTPDTGLGHYASMCGTPNVMFSLSNSVFWSGPNTIRITHPYGMRMIRSGALVDLSPKDRKDSFRYGESGEQRGALDIPPEVVAARVLQLIT